MTQGRGASNEKAKRAFHWSPRYPSWRDGFREMIGTTEQEEATTHAGCRLGDIPRLELNELRAGRPGWP